MLSVNSFLNSISGQDINTKKYENLIFLSHIMCKTYGWDYYVLIKQPIPFVLSLYDSIVKENKEEEKRAKGIRRR